MASSRVLGDLTSSTTSGREATPSQAAENRLTSVAPSQNWQKLSCSPPLKRFQGLVRKQSHVMLWSRVRGGLQPAGGQKPKAVRGVRLSELAEMLGPDSGGAIVPPSSGMASLRRHHNLKVTPAKIDLHIAPDENLLCQFLEKNPVDKGVQCSPSMSEHWVSTDHAEKHSQGVNHVEGGWPKDINPAEADQTQRFRKKIEKEDGFVQTIKELGNAMIHCIMQNNAVDIYQDYFEGNASWGATGSDVAGGGTPSRTLAASGGGSSHGGPNVAGDSAELDAPSAKIVAVFKDFSETTAGACGNSGDKRSACKISWSPDAGRKLAVSYAVTQFYGVKPDVAKESCIWDVENANVPELVLESKTNLVSLEFNPKDCNVLAAGMDRGQLAWWDLRRGPAPVEVTPSSVSHTEPVYSLIWINSKQGTEWFSAAADGKALWWDSRKLSEPTDSMVFDIRGSRAGLQMEGLTCRGPLGASCLEFEQTIPTRFMVGTEQGKVALCTRKAKNPSERILSLYSAHGGPVYAVQRNPMALKNFLTVGDWSAKVWAEDVRDSAIICTTAQPARLIDGTWNPTRPCTFYTANLDGVLDVWDILAYHSRPIFSLQVCDEALQCIRVEDSGQLLAAGSVNGNTYLIQMSESLTRMSKNERTLMTALLEREAHREKLLEQRVKEQRVKERTGGGRSSRGASGTPGVPEERIVLPMDHEALEKAKQDYLAQVKAELEQRTLTEEQALAEIALLDSDSRMPVTDDEKILLEATTINAPPGSHELMEIRREAEAIMAARGQTSGYGGTAAMLNAFRPSAIPDDDEALDFRPEDGEIEGTATQRSSARRIPGARGSSSSQNANEDDDGASSDDSSLGLDR